MAWSSHLLPSTQLLLISHFKEKPAITSLQSLTLATLLGYFIFIPSQEEFKNQQNFRKKIRTCRNSDKAILFIPLWMLWVSRTCFPFSYHVFSLGIKLLFHFFFKVNYFSCTPVLIPKIAVGCCFLEFSLIINAAFATKPKMQKTQWFSKGNFYFHT